VILVFTWILVKVGGQEVGVVITPQGIDQTSIKNRMASRYAMEYCLQMTERSGSIRYQRTRRRSEKYADAIWTPTKDGIKMG